MIEGLSIRSGGGLRGYVWAPPLPSARLHLDLAIVAEDHDADIVRLEIERHAAHAILELDHLAGLHVIQPVDAGDAVADREHLADLGHFRLAAEVP
jgi:hypothetical protein